MSTTITIPPELEEKIAERAASQGKKAIEAGAQFLVTRDHDLLDLMRDTEEGRDFKSRFRQLKILDPLAFLKEIEAA